MGKLEDSHFYSELETALEAAKTAGEIMDRYNSSGGAEVTGEKRGRNDIVTEADTECQEKIVEVIKEKFPEDGFLGEEEHLEPDGQDRVWVIDPIDGTNNFQKGWRYFCASIGLKVDGEHVVGVVHSPESGVNRTYIAIKNHGSYRLEGDMEDGELVPLSVSNREEIAGSIFTCYQSPDVEERREIEKEIIKHMIDRDANYRETGSGALTLCEIAEGGRDLRFDLCSEWDYAAGGLILEEAGGKFEILGSRLGKTVLVGTNNGLHSQFKNIVEKALEDSKHDRL